MPLDKSQAPAEYTPTVNTEVVTVQALGPWGFQTSSGEWLNFSKQFNEEDKAKVVPGSQLRCELYAAQSGKRYLNRIEAIEAVSKELKKIADPTVTGKVRMNAICAAYASPLLALRAIKPDMVRAEAEQIANHICEYTMREEKV